MPDPTKSTTPSLARISLRRKLMLLVAGMSVPMLVLGYVYFQQIGVQVRQTRSELQGAGYLQVLGNLLIELQNWRGREYTYLNGDKSGRGELLSQESEVDRQIALADSLDAAQGRALGTTPHWQQVKSAWLAIRSRAPDATAAAADSSADTLGILIAGLRDEVADRSLATADPDVYSHALLQTAVQAVPELVLSASELRRHAADAATKGYLGADDRTAIRIFGERRRAALAAVRDALIRAPLPSADPVREAADVFEHVAEQYDRLVEARLLTATHIEAGGGDVYESGLSADRAVKQLSAVTYSALQAALQQRQAMLLRQRATVAGTIVILLAMALTLTWLINRSLAIPLRRAIRIFERITAGHYHSRILVSGRDETSQLLRALARMQESLRTQIDSERHAAAETARIRLALDKASRSVLLGDADHRIVYLNDAARALFTDAQTGIRSLLPGFDAAALLGSSLCALAADPGAERAGLDNIAQAQTAERCFGRLTFRTVSTPVFADGGKRIGTVIEWIDRTPELAVERELQTVLCSILKGDLTSRLTLVGKSGFFEAASRGINQLADNLAAMVGSVKLAANEVYLASREIATGNTSLQRRSEEQSASLEQTATSMEQMTQTVRRNADNADAAKQLAVAARCQAEEGGAVVSQAVHAMSEINASARRISDIISVIDELAFQTSLLALNAAVEAARAGGRGRGFGVVASEVRTLGGRAASAAKQIKELIRDSSQKMSEGEVLVTRSGQTLEDIVASVKKVSDIVAEIAAASREQSAGIGQVNSAVLQMDDLTQQDAALVEQAATASQALAEEARVLLEVMSHYRLDESNDPGAADHLPATANRLPSSASPADAASLPAKRRSPARPRSRNLARPVIATMSTEDSEWMEF